MKNTSVMSCIGARANGRAYLAVLKRWVTQAPIPSSFQGLSVSAAAGSALVAPATDHVFRGRTTKQYLTGPPREAFQT